MLLKGRALWWCCRVKCLVLSWCYDWRSGNVKYIWSILYCMQMSLKYNSHVPAVSWRGKKKTCWFRTPIQKLGCFKMCTVWQQILNTSIVFSSHRWPQNLAEQVSSWGSKLSCWSKLCLSPNWPLLNIKLADWVNNVKLRWTLHINWTTLSSINCSISDNGS